MDPTPSTKRTTSPVRVRKSTTGAYEAPLAKATVMLSTTVPRVETQLRSSCATLLTSERPMSKKGAPTTRGMSKKGERSLKSVSIACFLCPCAPSIFSPDLRRVAQRVARRLLLVEHLLHGGPPLDGLADGGAHGLVVVDRDAATVGRRRGDEGVEDPNQAVKRSLWPETLRT